MTGRPVARSHGQLDVKPAATESDPPRLLLRINGMNARITAVVLVTLLMLGACGGTSDETATTSTPTGATAVADDPTGTTTVSTTGATTAATAVADDPTDTTTAQADEASEEPTVTIEKSRFDTPELRVAVGTTVRFVNLDPYDHTVTSKDDAPIEFDSGKFGEQETFEFTFDEPGEFSYFCQIHPTMRAVVIVEA